MRADPLPTPACLAPDVARRVGLILAAVAALIARRFLAEPRLVALIVPLWTRLNQAARRFQRLMQRVAAGRLPTPRRCTARSVRPVPPPHRTPIFPTGRGWLVRVLGWEAAGYASQLEHLLAEPGVADLLAAAPAAQRILRPLRHMLGVGPARRRPTSRRTREPRPLPPRPRAQSSLSAPGGGEGRVRRGLPRTGSRGDLLTLPSPP